MSWPMYFWYSRGRPASRPPQRIGLAQVPVGDEVVAVRVGVDQQDDHVVEDAARLVVVAADQAVDGLDQLLRAEHLVGVQPAVDPDHRLALGGERLGLGVGEALGQGQAAGDLLVAAEPLLVLGRGDDGHQLRPALGGLADLDQRQPVRLGVELAPVVGQLPVGGELVVVADVEAELGLGGGDARCAGGGLGVEPAGRDAEDGGRDQRGRTGARTDQHGGMLTGPRRPVVPDAAAGVYGVTSGREWATNRPPRGDDRP